MERHSVDTQPYWEALTQKKLVVQKCGECGRFRHYPQPMCAHCHSQSVVWTQVRGEGTVHSWTVTHHTRLPGFADQVPYALVTVDLAEGIRMVAPLRLRAPESIRTGLPVRLVFEVAANESVLPAFVVAD